VRHLLYTCVIVLLWANPVASLDRLVLAGVWTTWIVVGALLEERDLISDFGRWNTWSGHRGSRWCSPIGVWATIRSSLPPA
jgi:protein-S-isoprenylcysteine O-methyltransferase Ste14